MWDRLGHLRETRDVAKIVRIKGGRTYDRNWGEKSMFQWMLQGVTAFYQWDAK
jgi:hypothetical protein